MISKGLGAVLLASTVGLAAGSKATDGYDVARTEDGPFSFSITGVTLNEGSSMQRESILFNDPSCPIKVHGHSTSITYKDRGFRFTGKTSIEVLQPVAAVEIRTTLFDVFGRHMKNLSNAEPKDLEPGASELRAEWRARDNDCSELLTSVTYVARVRLADGRQWVFNRDSVDVALTSLDLENKIEDDDSLD